DDRIIRIQDLDSRNDLLRHTTRDSFLRWFRTRSRSVRLPFFRLPTPGSRLLQLHGSSREFHAFAGFHSASNVRFNLSANFDMLPFDEALGPRPTQAESGFQHGRERLPGLSTVDHERDRRHDLSHSSIVNAFGSIFSSGVNFSVVSSSTF